MQFISRKTADGEEVQMIPKLEAVKEEMQEFIDKIKRAQTLNELREKPRKIEWNTRIYSRLEFVLLRLQRPMPYSEAQLLTADDLYEIYAQYCDLCCWIEDETNIAFYKNKSMFCYFAAITTEAFEKLKGDGGDPNQREALNNIEDRLVESLQMAAENGQTKGKPSEFHMTSKGRTGYKIQTTTAHEPIIAIPVTNKSFTPIEPPPVVPKLGKGSK